jgi:hypothetical protein
MKALLDPKQLVYRGVGPVAPRAPKPPRHRAGEKFLKGPVPLTWLARAAQLPGKSLHVGIVLWFVAGLHRRRTVPLSSELLSLLGVDRHAKYRALAWLEHEGLVAIDRRPGCNPIVTLLEPEAMQ